MPRAALRSPASIRHGEHVDRVAALGGTNLGAERGRDDSEHAEAGRDGDALLAVHRVGDRVAVRRVAEAALPQDSRPTPASAAAGQCLPYRRCLRLDPRAGRSSSCRPGRAGRRPRHLSRPRVERQRRVRIERVVRRRHPAAGRPWLRLRRPDIEQVQGRVVRAGNPGIGSTAQMRRYIPPAAVVGIARLGDGRRAPELGAGVRVVPVWGAAGPKPIAASTAGSRSPELRISAAICR